MKKKTTLLLLFSVLLVLVAGILFRNHLRQQEQLPLDATVFVTDNWVFERRPSFEVQVTNPHAEAAKARVLIEITTDKKDPVKTIEKSIQLAAGAAQFIPLSTPSDLAPGFYQAHCFVNGKAVRSFVFGISPTDLVSAPDKQDDFDLFWDTAKKQLFAVEMNPVLTEIPARSSPARKVYLVEMQSIPDGLDGNPVTIRGYYCEPRDGKKHPVLLHYFGYDDYDGRRIPCPSGGPSQEFAEFFLSTRGQIINNRTAALREPDGKGDFASIYGDWFAYHFGDKDSYYYRGAFMDCIQAVRFMATRPTSDMDNLFAEGSSQGGAFSYAAAALSDIPFTAIAPGVAFLSDYPDYFDIVEWPGNTARENQGSMTDAQMFAFLSYFDTKNLATRIHCAVIASSGLQDETCPPHTNMAPYNNLAGKDKEMHFYPEMGHEVPPGWQDLYMEFFRERIR